MLLLAISGRTVATILIVILLILLAVLALLYFMGRKLQRQQVEQQGMIEANTMDVSMLVIDKKKLGIEEAIKAGIPQQIRDNVPFYLKMTKLPVVKAKVGPKIMALLADPEVFDLIPVKKEVKVSVSGLYIRSIKSVRGGSLEQPKKKQGFFSKLRGKAREMQEQQVAESAGKSNKSRKNKK